MTPEEEAVMRAVIERDEQARIQESLAAQQGRREDYQNGRMKLLDKFMPMPADAPQVPPMPIPGPRLQDIVNPKKVPSPNPAQPVVPIIGTRG